jgi:hypothetical protein
VLPLSIVGEIVLKLSTRTGYSHIWPHKIQLGQNWLQAPLQEGVEDQSTTVDCGSTGGGNRGGMIEITGFRLLLLSGMPFEDGTTCT